MHLPTCGVRRVLQKWDVFGLSHVQLNITVTVSLSHTQLVCEDFTVAASLFSSQLVCEDLSGYFTVPWHSTLFDQLDDAFVVGKLLAGKHKGSPTVMDDA